MVCAGHKFLRWATDADSLHCPAHLRDPVSVQEGLCDSRRELETVPGAQRRCRDGVGVCHPKALFLDCRTVSLEQTIAPRSDHFRQAFLRLSCAVWSALFWVCKVSAEDSALASKERDIGSAEQVT